ncbi:MAG: tRNA (guanosine(37)-N1)-methyltransferase TrmD [Lachnospiraceae bacterium]|nr:tRNA (guanosine(37)-N1)-methyltransferase TrmD [Lachnospiraceae bacterium]
MNYHVLTLFPDMIRQACETSILGRAVKNGTIAVETVNIRDFSANKHNRVDDYPYGGGAGMVMEAEPVYRAVSSVSEKLEKKPRVIYLTPQGRVLNQTMVEEFALEDELVLLCGHYEGIDERVLEEVVTDYVSIGDYVLTGGELGAMVLIDSISRFVPGVLSNEESSQFESLQDNLLEYPHYTRPEIWRDRQVPEVLLSGDHKKIEAWRKEQSILRTKERRPDLLEKSVRVRSLFYGTDLSASLAADLTEALSRYGEVMDFNRKKLRKTRWSFERRELLLFVLDTLDEDFFNVSMKGHQTPVFLITGEGVDPADAERFKEQLTSRRFRMLDTFPMEVLQDKEALKRTAIEMRKQL